ncbi:hypothetical protein Tsubulata_015508 [Turnera subulata]|uniref:Endonuclease/exonuclease/phosphatase domain-containing protein n=1 Tax=Turnera subulata TaxID=218843 RepID=A0A9Q0GAC5_9ROSI|nr:hypothetical protein Tsubulata_015508 [Turnera subulata]
MIAVILEPRISGMRASRVIRKLGFRRSHRVEARGYSGGIWVLWREELVSVHFLINHAQFIHMKVCTAWGSFLLTAIYGSPSASNRKYLWQNLEVLSSTTTEPWLLAGDFNATLCTSESTSQRRTPSCSMKEFQNTLLNAGLLDLGYSGPSYTWQRGRLKKRLDRAISNATANKANLYFGPQPPRG